MDFKCYTSFTIKEKEQKNEAERRNWEKNGEMPRSVRRRGIN